MLPLVVFPVIGVTGIMLPRRSVKIAASLRDVAAARRARAEAVADIDRRHIRDNRDVKLLRRWRARRS